MAPLFVALHDLDLVHMLPRHGGGGGGGDEDGGEGKLGGFHVQGSKRGQGRRGKKMKFVLGECVGGTKGKRNNAQSSVVATDSENKTSAKILAPKHHPNFRSPSWSASSKLQFDRIFSSFVKNRFFSNGQETHFRRKL